MLPYSQSNDTGKRNYSELQYDKNLDLTKHQDLDNLTPFQSHADLASICITKHMFCNFSATGPVAAVYSG